MSANEKFCLEMSLDDDDPVEMEMSDDNCPSIDLFDPAEIRRKLAEGYRAGGFEIGDPPALSSEEETWRKRLRQILDDPKNPRRKLLIADDKMAADIAGLEAVSPHFKSPLGLIGRAAKLSLKTQTPLAIPPLLLVGPPGLGKSFFARRLAEVIGTEIEFVSGDLLSDRGSLTGLSISWRAARPGRIASALLNASTASPVVVLDEVDKVSSIHPAEKPLAFLHSLLEPENARKYQDEYLSFAMRADQIIWILTANSVDGLERSIVDRLTVFQIDEPSAEMAASVIKSIYASVNAQFANAFDPEVRDDIVGCLLEINARHVRKLLELGFGYAMEAGRAFLVVKDIRDAQVILDDNSARKRAIGFI